MAPPGTAPRSPLTDDDLWQLAEGTHRRLADVLGGHLDDDGAEVRVWAPRAQAVAVASDANGWDPAATPLAPLGETGIWTGRLDGAAQGDAYKLLITGSGGGDPVEHADPFARHTDTPPANASKLWTLDHDWQDAAWMAGRADRQRPEAPISLYELHLGSWMRGEDGRRHLTYREVAPHLIAHLDRMGFTHVELMPLTEHPFYGSWGYQTTGYFAPTSRYGAPEDLMWLIDQLHQAGYGVVLDWVPSHFPDDWWGLARFDGEPLFEHPDPRRGRHPDWNSAVFDYGRGEVRSFLISSALFWLREYHVDGLRLDAVASMLYLDYSRGPGQWAPNAHGGNEHLEAIAFLQQLNDAVHAEVPDALTFAEESTAWPKVTHPSADGGLAFDQKWDLGWAHDTLGYLATDPIHRGGAQEQLTFRTVYQHAERFTLPLSHDEVVHGKGSLRDRVHRPAGDDGAWQQLANLRLLVGLQMTATGKPLLFMGTELAQQGDWDVEGQLPWGALRGPDAEPAAAQQLAWVAAITSAYRDLPALHAGDHHPDGFEWVDADDRDHSIISFLRRDPASGATALVVVNGTPVPRPGYRIGVPDAGPWRQVLDSDDPRFGGRGVVGPVGTPMTADDVPAHGRDRSLALTLPPLGLRILTPGGG